MLWVSRKKNEFVQYILIAFNGIQCTTLFYLKYQNFCVQASHLSYYSSSIQVIIEIAKAFYIFFEDVWESQQMFHFIFG